MGRAFQNGRRTVAVGSAAGLILAAFAAAPGAGAQSDAPAAPGEEEMVNLQHVFNFNTEEHDQQGDPDADPPVDPPPLGSDLEFFTQEVPVDSPGKRVSKKAKPRMVERDFAVMGSYQRGGYVFDITDPESPQFVSQVTCRQNRNDVAIKKFNEGTDSERVVLALSQQSGVPCGDQDEGGVGVLVNSPADLAGFSNATQWSGSAAVDDQRADLVYAGTGCTPLHYAGADVEGKIALVDKFANADGVEDCPTFTFKQKMDAAERAGAIGLVQVDDNNERTAGNAISSGIPGLEITNSDGTPIRDAVVGGETVNVTLTEGPSDIPVIGEGSGGVGVFDITNPYEWKPMYRLLLPADIGGVHNFIFHPTKPLGYVSNGALPGGFNEIPIIDFSDVDNPKVLIGPDTEGGVHDLEFSPGGNRAYAASENNYRIYDTTNPWRPELVSRTPNVGSYAHGVFPSFDLELMVTNNESLVLGGFFVEGSGVCPGEGLASYDIAGDNENQPAGPLGYYTPNVVGPTDERPCTSHFGRFAPDAKVMSIGWYIAGSRVVDWTDPSSPQELAAAVMPDTNTWAAKFHQGPYLYAGDMGRGFDVFRWSGGDHDGDGDEDAPWEP